MGFFENMGDSFVKGKDTAQRGGKALKLKTQIYENESKRRDYCAQLGASVYEETKSNDDYRRPRESIYEMIDQLDVEKVDLQAQLSAIESEDTKGDVAPDAPDGPVCPQCGASIGDNSRFCPECGAQLK